MLERRMLLLCSLAVIACLLALISEREGLLAKAGDKTAGAVPTPGPRSQAQSPFTPKDLQELTLLYWTVEDCKVVPDCHNFNPYNAYGILSMPADPQDRDRKCTKQDIATGVCKEAFMMSGNDVLLLYGWTFPDAKYFNFILNQFDRSDGEGGREQTKSSIGLGINHLTLKHFGEDPFGAPFFMILSASTAAAAYVKDFLISGGYSEEWINVYLFHRDFANGYLGEEADNFKFLYRISFPDEESLTAYAATDQVKAYLIRGLPTAVGDVTEMEEWVPRPDPAELDQEDDLLTLITEIINYYWSEQEMPELILLEELTHLDPLACRGEEAHPELCRFDNPDALYFVFKTSETDILRPFLDEDDFIILAGINHGLYQLETYFAYFFYRNRDRFVFTYFNDEDMIGSAQQYWPEAGEDFFAYKLAHNCNGEPGCHEFPTGEWGLNPGERFVIGGRVCLDPVSKTGPHPDNFVPSVLLWYQN